MEEQECRVRPVGDPQEDVVPASVEDEQRKVCKRKHAHAVGIQRQELFLLASPPRVGRLLVEHDEGPDNVDDRDVHKEQSLPSCGNYGQVLEYRDIVTGSEDRRLDDVGVELADDGLGKRNKPQERAENGDSGTSEEDDKASDMKSQRGLLGQLYLIQLPNMAKDIRGLANAYLKLTCHLSVLPKPVFPFAVAI